MSVNTATDTQKIVTDLNAGWYNVIVQACNLDPATFQLAQGTLGLQTSDSSGLFRMADAVPPSASVAYFDPSGLSTRSSAYQLLLGALLPETGSDLAVALGDMYPNWLAYRDAWWAANPASSITQEQLFTQWANQRLDPRKASSAINTYKQSANAPLNLALDALHAPAGQQQFVSSDQKTYYLPRYTTTHDAAVQAINNGGSATIDFNSASMDTHLSHRTVQGSATGFYEFFSAGASGSFEQLNQSAGSSAWTVTGTIGKYATLVATAGSWFTPAEYTRAYTAKGDARIWDPMATAGEWSAFFEQPNGSLARRVGQLFLVSDYSITVTSKATYSQDDVTRIRSEARFGVWPFFSASVSTSDETRYTLNSDSTMSVTHTLPKGQIQIWGASVTDAPQ